MGANSWCSSTVELVINDTPSTRRLIQIWSSIFKIYFQYFRQFARSEEFEIIADLIVIKLYFAKSVSAHHSDLQSENVTGMFPVNSSVSHSSSRGGNTSSFWQKATRSRQRMLSYSYWQNVTIFPLRANNTCWLFVKCYYELLLAWSLVNLLKTL